MNVLIVSNVYHPNFLGGAEKVAQKLAEELVARGHQVVVVTLSAYNKPFEVTHVNGVRVYYVPVRNLYPLVPLAGRFSATKGLWHALDTYNPFMAAALDDILDKEQPDVVNTHNIAGFSWSIWQSVKRRRIPLVHTMHDYYLLCPRSTMRRNGANCTKLCGNCSILGKPRKYGSRLVDVATGVSRSVLDRHVEFGYFQSAESMAIHNWSEPPSGCTGHCNEGSPSLRFGFLGRLHPSKGVELLVRSFLKLSPGKAELVLAGRGTPDYERHLVAIAEGRADIRWQGFVTPKDFFRQIDVLVVPSLWQDPAPLVVLECLTAGIPLIGSRLGGIPELMGDGTGWLFNPGDPVALELALQNAIELRKQLSSMGACASKRAASFSIQVMIDGYLQAFSRAIDKAGHR